VKESPEEGKQSRGLLLKEEEEEVIGTLVWRW
jgi:hypothetical protein